MTFETPSLPFRISLYLSGSGGGGEGGVADITWNGPFCVDRKAELIMAPTHKHPVKKKGASFETYSNSNNELDF